MGAGVAFAAVHLGFNGHPLTHLELGDSLPQRRDLAGDLVALGDRVLGVGVLAVVYVDVGAADADALDFHQHLPGPGRGNGHPVKPDLPGGRHHFLQHGFLHHTHTPLFGPVRCAGRPDG